MIHIEISEKKKTDDNVNLKCWKLCMMHQKDGSNIKTKEEKKLQATQFQFRFHFAVKFSLV